MELESRRARRIRHTRRICARRLSDHFRLQGPDYWPWPPEYSIKDEAGWWDKHNLACNCSKRLHGQPKLHHGLCHWGDRVRVYVWRRQLRKLKVEVRNGADVGGDRVTNLSVPQGPYSY